MPASPSGPAYVAGALLQAGHDVAVYESLFAVDLAAELSAVLLLFQPEVVGISIRLVHGDVQDADAPFGTWSTCQAASSAPTGACPLPHRARSSI